MLDARGKVGLFHVFDAFDDGASLGGEARSGHAEHVPACSDGGIRDIAHEALVVASEHELVAARGDGFAEGLCRFDVFRVKVVGRGTEHANFHSAPFDSRGVSSMLAQLPGFSKTWQRRFRLLHGAAFGPMPPCRRVVTFAKKHLESNIYSF